MARVNRTSVNQVAHRRFRDRWTGSRQQPGWCAEHQDFAWGFDDGSVECFHQTAVEMGTQDCDFVPGTLMLPRGTVTRPATQVPKP